MRLHFSIVGYDYRRTTRLRQSIHFRFTQVFFADHVHWRSGVDNKILFPQFKSWCRQAPIFRRWEECCFIFLLSFQDTSCILHSVSRACRSCLSVSSWDRSSNFGALELRWWGSPGQITPSDCFLVSNVCMTHDGFCEFYTRIGFSMFEFFRKIDEDFGGSISWNEQPNCRVFFKYSHCNSVTILLDFLLGCSSTWRCT